MVALQHGFNMGKHDASDKHDNDLYTMHVHESSMYTTHIHEFFMSIPADAHNMLHKAL
jgi:hypothetical protein